MPWLISAGIDVAETLSRTIWTDNSISSAACSHHKPDPQSRALAPVFECLSRKYSVFNTLLRTLSFPVLMAISSSWRACESSRRCPQPSFKVPTCHHSLYFSSSNRSAVVVIATNQSIECRIKDGELSYAYNNTEYTHNQYQKGIRLGINNIIGKHPHIKCTGPGQVQTQTCSPIDFDLSGSNHAQDQTPSG